MENISLTSMCLFEKVQNCCQTKQWIRGSIRFVCKFCTQEQNNARRLNHLKLCSIRLKLKIEKYEKYEKVGVVHSTTSCWGKVLKLYIKDSTLFQCKVPYSLNGLQKLSILTIYFCVCLWEYIGVIYSLKSISIFSNEDNHFLNPYLVCKKNLLKFIINRTKQNKQTNLGDVCHI